MPINLRRSLAGGNRPTEPDSIKRRVSGPKYIHRIKLMIGNHSRWRYRTDPPFGPLPGPNRCRIIHTNGAVSFDNSASSFAGLPFQCVACQRLTIRALPHVTPKIFFAFGPLTFLNSFGHV